MEHAAAPPHVLLLESHWRAVKELNVAAEVSSQVDACKPGKQSAECEREVTHHRPRNTNTDLWLSGSPWALLLQCSPRLCRCVNLGGWKYCDRHIWNWLWAFCCLLWDTAGEGLYSMCSAEGRSRALPKSWGPSFHCSSTVHATTEKSTQATVKTKKSCTSRTNSEYNFLSNLLGSD